MSNHQVHRRTAFTTDPLGGNPAGVVIAEEELDASWMQQIAAEVGYSETAFLWPDEQPSSWIVRYFSPQVEVPFCGHATIAAGTLLAEQHGNGRHGFLTRAGLVEVDVEAGEGPSRAALTSVEPRMDPLPAEVLASTLAALGWEPRHLRPDLEPVISFAGARHLILPVRSRSVLAELAYDFEALLAVSREHDLLTFAAMWQEGPTRWHARNAFPLGGVIEDPATGSAAASFGGWLRASGLVVPPTTIEVHQGDDMGQPSRLDVEIRASGGIVVAGHAVPL